MFYLDQLFLNTRLTRYKAFIDNNFHFANAERETIRKFKYL